MFYSGFIGREMGTAVQLRQKAILKREAEKEEATTAKGGTQKAEAGT